LNSLILNIGFAYISSISTLQENYLFQKSTQKKKKKTIQLKKKNLKWKKKKKKNKKKKKKKKSILVKEEHWTCVLKNRNSKNIFSKLVALVVKGKTLLASTNLMLSEILKKNLYKLIIGMVGLANYRHLYIKKKKKLIHYNIN